MNKEDLEKRIKQDLMQKDKETIIDLYLQMKFERDIFDQQLSELKAELDAKETINQLYKSTLSLKDSDFSDLVSENTKLKQQRKEKDEEINKLMHCYLSLNDLETKTGIELGKLKKQLQSNTKQVCEKIRKDIQRKLDGQRYNFSEYCKGKEFAFLEINDILDQIEKGENV